MYFNEEVLSKPTKKRYVSSVAQQDSIFFEDFESIDSGLYIDDVLIVTPDTLLPPYGNFLVLDGIDDYAQAADHDELDLGDGTEEHLTVEAWINFDSLNFGNIIVKYDAYKLYTFENADYNNWPTLAIKVYFASTTYSPGTGWIFNNANLFTGWHHVAGVYNNNLDRLYFYMDGIRHTNMDVSVPGIDMFIKNSNKVLRIGHTFKGMIDEIRISDKVRYQESTYIVPSSPFELDDHTRALWHFDEPNGSNEFHDVAGYDNILTGYNGCTTSVEERDKELTRPTDFTLYQNYPNPFNPSTKIRFSLPKSGFVTLKIYNLLGKELETLVKEYKQASDYEVNWNAKNQPSGIYLYRLQAGEFIETKKLILQR